MYLSFLKIKKTIEILLRRRRIS